MSAVLTPDLIAKLESVDSPTVSNAIEIFKVRSRREGYMGPDIQCRFPDLGAVVGHAVTCTIVEYDENYPPDPAERTAWMKAIDDSTKADRPPVCVVRDECHRKGWSSHWGEMVGTRTKLSGSKAIITDGAVRDLEALHGMGMKTWSKHVVVSHGWIDVGQANIPVEVGGLIVNPGDILHADMNGIVCIPEEVIPDIWGEIEKCLANEQAALKEWHAETPTSGTLFKH
jgi:4-hydroxy-4-methyl-2-oxoglutarate aldolase